MLTGDAGLTAREIGITCGIINADAKDKIFSMKDGLETEEIKA